MEPRPAHGAGNVDDELRRRRVHGPRHAQRRDSRTRRVPEVTHAEEDGDDEQRGYREQPTLRRCECMQVHK